MSMLTYLFTGLSEEKTDEKMGKFEKQTKKEGETDSPE